MKASWDVRIVHGTPDHAELAALLAVLALARHRAASHAAREARARRAHWDRAWGGAYQPCGSWRAKAVTAFDPGVR
ncbi:acyl-CoA carboxylase epsilon subunit [Streptomyces sp. NPDC000410]|uniref:acyl-CoA carboxylase epsilon subunit n=1 Tax=Streptomyces sp. NPDC000410 TaxID=3154254 RepID=UPI003332F100